MPKLDAYLYSGDRENRKYSIYHFGWFDYFLGVFAPGVDSYMISPGLKSGALGQITKVICCTILAYWGVYALVTPVTNIDSQIYNIARLELAFRGGFFNNHLFTSSYHIIFPWTFDAVHLPFVLAGWGFALPSFACLAGTCFVVQVMVKSKYGPDAAWAAVAGILGLTCLVYQGTSTKNDMPVLFCGAVWAYGRWRMHQESRSVHLIWMVLAVCFMAGAKTTGLLFGAVLGFWMLWDLRSDRKLALQVIGGFAGGLVLLGSVETYVESARMFGAPLGPSKVISELKNTDGWRGGIANLTRHIAGGVYLGPVANSNPNRIAKGFVAAESNWLKWSGLTRAGVHPKYRDGPLILFQSGFEELSGFGPVGTIAVAMMLLACFRWRPGTDWWRLSIVAFMGIILVSFTISYTDWMKRYLIGWYALATVAAVCALWESENKRHCIFQWVFTITALASAIAAPLQSFNRGPSAIVASVMDRDRFETCNYPLIGKVRERLRVLRAAKPSCHIYYVVCDSSLLLPIIEDSQLDVVLVPVDQFLAIASSGRFVDGDLVIVDSWEKPQSITPFEEVSARNIFSDNEIVTQGIYKIPFTFSKAPPIK